MLSMQAEEERLNMGESAKPPSAPRFDNILGSIRHLAQDIDIDEIAAADKNINQLVEKLLSLEKQVLTLTEIRRKLNGVTADQSEPEKSSSDTEKVSSHGARIPNLIPFPIAAKPATLTAPVEPAVTANKKPAPDSPRPVALETNRAPEKPKSIATPQIVAAPQNNNTPVRPSEPTLEEKKRPSASPDTLVPFPAKPKENPQGKVMAREFPVWEKDPMTVEAPEVAVLESTLPAPTHSRAARDPQQRGSAATFTSRSREKEKAKYQVTYSFVDKRTNFDQRLRELVKTYGEVDIYSDNDASTRKRNLRKTAMVGLVLILAFSVFPGGASFISNFQQQQFNRLDPSPTAQPFTPKVSSSLVAATLPTATLPAADTIEAVPETRAIAIPVKQRKLLRKAQPVEASSKTPYTEPSKIEDLKKLDVSQTSTIVGQQSVTPTQTPPASGQQ